MSTIHRFLSRKDKHSSIRQAKPEIKDDTGPFNGLFEDEHKKTKSDKDEDQKIQVVLQGLVKHGNHTFRDTDIAYTLRTDYSNGDTDKAIELLALLKDSEEGIIQAFDPRVKMLGAVNREGVTCYLDALLFAMFARLGSFEAMLYKKFEDPSKKRLTTLLRLWVNILRTGGLIPADIIRQIQLQLSNCGWAAAAGVCQQDSSEAFTFITETLALPLLTLKMDIFHTGREDTTDDHKFVNERLLELAVPIESNENQSITLEECLEMYFNNKIEVKRYLSTLQRSGTMNLSQSSSSLDDLKAQACHVEVAEIDEPVTPMLPKTMPMSSPKPVKRARGPSIIREKVVDGEKDGFFDGVNPFSRDRRSSRIRKEVIMPAWQFFKLIPWYTNNLPSNDDQVAAHFSSTRPILGICLKRYSILPSGRAAKRSTHIDIPLEIGLPHFIHDDEISADGPAFGNFKLSLQSVVCHQGLSVDSGHYISLARNPDPNQQGEDTWMRFDDLAADRVIQIDVQQFLKQSTEQTPYLLFYQVIPIEGDPSDTPDRRSNVSSPVLDGVSSIPNILPPSYTASLSPYISQADSGISGVSSTSRDGSPSRTSADSASERASLEQSRPSLDLPRGRNSAHLERHSPSIVSRDGTRGSSGVPILIEGIEHRPSFSRRDSRNELDGPNALTSTRRGSNANKIPLSNSAAKTGSLSGDKRLSQSLSRLAGRISRDRLSVAVPTAIPSSPSKERPPGELPPPLVAQTQAALGVNGTSSDRDSSFDKGRQKKVSKDKGKGHENDRKIKGKPDRECSVM